MRRMPWLILLMMVQSLSSFVLQRYEKLIEENIVIASFLTMLVGGGGNAAVQVVTDIVRAMTRAQHDKTGAYSKPRFWRTLGREMLLAVAVSVTLGLFAFLRVRYVSLGSGASKVDALAIALSYVAIILMAIFVAVVVTSFFCE